MQTGDFDGDGNTDYILFLYYVSDIGDSGDPMDDVKNFEAFISYPARGMYNKLIYESNNSPINQHSLWAANHIANSDKVFVIDMDGDGKMEIMTVNEDGTRIFRFGFATGFAGNYEYVILTEVYNNSFPNSNLDIFLGDFNGDRKADFFYDQSPPKIAYSNGNSFEIEHLPEGTEHFVAPNNGNCYGQILVADYNGDGKSDILHIANHTGGNPSDYCPKLTCNMYYSGKHHKANYYYFYNQPYINSKYFHLK